jgi:CheY-like chemotaxis protein
MENRELHILLVDDDEVDVMNVQRALLKNHIANPVHVATNGIEALEKLRDGSIASTRLLVLLDLNMPKMNGIEFLRELRADPKLHATSVVVLTTSNEQRDKVDAFQFNVAGYMLKPVTFAKFIEIMATINKYWLLVEMP